MNNDYCPLCGLRNSHWAGCNARDVATTTRHKHTRTLPDTQLDDMIDNITRKGQPPR